MSFMRAQHSTLPAQFGESYSTSAAGLAKSFANAQELHP
jgi:hypothetical protein